MDWLRIVQVAWPIVSALTLLIIAVVVLWLKSQFPTKADLKKAEEDSAKGRQQLGGEVEALERDVADRFERGSRKFAEHDRRLAVVEKECEGAPTKADLHQMISVLGGRMSGVESSLKGVEKLLATQHDYLRAVIEGQGSK